MISIWHKHRALPVAEQKWVPSKIEDDNRTSRIIGLLADAFSLNEYQGWPTEIRSNILAYLIQAYSVSNVETLCAKYQGDDVPLDWLSDEIWAQHVKVDGRWYVCRLTKTKPEGGGPSIRLRKPPVLDSMHVAVDYAGVRRIVLDDSEDPITVFRMDSGLWWQTIRLPASPKIKLVSDVSPKPKLSGYVPG